MIIGASTIIEAAVLDSEMANAYGSLLSGLAFERTMGPWLVAAQERVTELVLYVKIR
jgi:hypothetical protein